MVSTGETVGLAEWIIDDTCLVFLLIILWRQNQYLQGDFNERINFLIKEMRFLPWTKMYMHLFL